MTFFALPGGNCTWTACLYSPTKFTALWLASSQIKRRNRSTSHLVFDISFVLYCRCKGTSFTCYSFSFPSNLSWTLHVRLRPHFLAPKLLLNPEHFAQVIKHLKCGLEIPAGSPPAPTDDDKFHFTPVSYSGELLVSPYFPCSLTRRERGN